MEFTELPFDHFRINTETQAVLLRKNMAMLGLVVRIRGNTLKAQE